MQTRLQTRVRVPPPPPPRREGPPISPQRHDDDEFVQVPSTGTAANHPLPVIPKQDDRVSDKNKSERRSSSDEWLLRVRTPPENYPPHSILSFHITPDMTASTLAACIQQSMCLPQPLVGLFQESRVGHFYTLEHVLQSKERELVYTVLCTPPPRATSSVPWYQQFMPWLLLFSFLILLWTFLYWPLLLYLMERTLTWLYQGIVQIPLTELYRYGPWMVGWEGASLPHICSRITYHGDEVFWSRNLEECQRIFDQKQDAWLQMARPLWWILLSSLVLMIVRWLVDALRHSPPPPDRDMVETYRAWQILLQQASRTFHQQPLLKHKNEIK
jgi:hypothetical protein